MEDTGKNKKTFFVFRLSPFQAGERFFNVRMRVCVCLKKRAGTVSGVVVSLWNRLCCVKQASLTAVINK